MRFLMMVFLSLFVASAAHAQSTPPAQGGASSVLGDLANVVFDEAEKRLIKEYYDRVPGAKKSDEDDDKNEDDDKDKANKKDKKGKGAKGKGRGNGLPPGLAKRDQLPPGLAKRGNQLPPGLMKGDLPPDLEKDLGDLPENVERVIVDSDVLLVQKGTEIILDVLEGVITGQ